MPSVRPPPPPPLLLLDSTLPKGVRLGVAKVINIIAAPPNQHKQQLGLFATCGFEAGELIFQGQATLIDAGPSGEEGASDSAEEEEEAPYALLTLRGDPAEAADVAAADAAAAAAASTSVHPIRLRRHTTRLPIGHTRLLHAGVASFMNHGCDPSTVVEAVTTGDSDGGDVVVSKRLLARFEIRWIRTMEISCRSSSHQYIQRYDVRAARRLEPGAELSCDYTLVCVWPCVIYLSLWIYQSKSNLQIGTFSLPPSPPPPPTTTPFDPTRPNTTPRRRGWTPAAAAPPPASASARFGASRCGT